MQRVHPAIECEAAGSAGADADPAITVTALGAALRDVVDLFSQRVTEKCEDFGKEILSKLRSGQRQRLGGVRSAGRGEKIHEVVLGDAAFPPEVWVTRCGWRFGLTSHERCSEDLVSCAKCLEGVRRVSSARGGQAG